MGVRLRVEHKDEDEDEIRARAVAMRAVAMMIMLMMRTRVSPTYSSDAQNPFLGNGWLLPPKHVTPNGHASH